MKRTVLLPLAWLLALVCLAQPKHVRLSDTEVSYVYHAEYTSPYGTHADWGATFTFDEATGEVRIHDMLKGLSSSANIDVKGTVADGRIIIPTKDPADDPDGATIVWRYNDENYYYLLSGDVEKGYGGAVNVVRQDKLELQLSADSATISADKYVVLMMASPYGSYTLGYWMPDFSRMEEVMAASVKPGQVDFGTIFYTERPTGSITLTSEGSLPLVYDVSMSNDAFSVAVPHDTLGYQESRRLDIVFAPDGVGEYSGVMTIASRDTTITLPLTGKAIDVPSDFSSLIVEGDRDFFDWDNRCLHPWMVSEGTATALTSDGMTGESVLTGSYDSASAMLLTMNLNVNIWAIDTLTLAIDDIPSMQFTTKYDGRWSMLLPAGKHRVTWTDWRHGDSPNGMSVRMSGFCLQEASPWDGLSPDGSVTDIAATQWTNYDGRLIPTDNMANAVFTLNPTDDSNISFDVKATEQKMLFVMIDGKNAGTLKRDTVFHANLTAGEHTLRLTANATDFQTDGELSVSNLRLTKGDYIVTDASFMMTGDSYFDENGIFTLSDGLKGVSFPVQVKMDNAGRFEMSGLFPMDNAPVHKTVKGTVMDGKVRVPCAQNFNTGQEIAEQADTWSQGFRGNAWWIVGGTPTSKKNVDAVDTLTISMSDDGRRLTFDQPVGMYMTWSFYNQGLVQFFKSGATMTMIDEGVMLEASTDTIRFGKMYVGTGQLEQKFTISNKGSRDAAYSIVVSGDEAFAVNVEQGVIPAAKTHQFTVSFQPQAVGQYEADLLVSTESGTMAIHLCGQAEQLPDYGSIVTEGLDLVTGWNTSDQYPWAVADGAAMTTNGGHHNSKSSLTMTLSIPEGKAARFSCRADVDVEAAADEFCVSVDGKPIYSIKQRDAYALPSAALAAGEHTISWSQAKNVNDVVPCRDTCYVSDVRITLYDVANAVFAEAPAYRADRLLPVGETSAKTIRLVNMTGMPLTVTAAEAPEAYTVELPTKEVEAGATASIDCLITPTEPGRYDGTVSLSTSAGEVDFTMEAEADYVRYLGDDTGMSFTFPYDTNEAMYGNYDMQTQNLYQEQLFDGLKGARITDITFFTSVEADVAYTCEEVEYSIGRYDYDKITENYPAGLTTVYSGKQPNVDYYEQNIHFDEPFRYEGGNIMLTVNRKSEEQVGYQVYYLMTSNNGQYGRSGYYHETYDYLYDFPFVAFARIKYEPAERDAATGITQTMGDTQEQAGRQIVGTAYYSLSGQKLDAPQAGLNIVVMKYADGTSKSVRRCF